MNNTNRQLTVDVYVVMTLAVLAAGQASVLFAEEPAGCRDEIQPVVDSFSGFDEKGMAMAS